eukprot:1196352-Prorocentrum_minimum.AAC.1
MAFSFRGLPRPRPPAALRPLPPRPAPSFAGSSASAGFPAPAGELPLAAGELPPPAALCPRGRKSENTFAGFGFGGGSCFGARGPDATDPTAGAPPPAAPLPKSAAARKGSAPPTDPSPLLPSLAGAGTSETFLETTGTSEITGASGTRGASRTLGAWGASGAAAASFSSCWLLASRRSAALALRKRDTADLALPAGSCGDGVLATKSSESAPGSDRGGIVIG